MVKQETIKMTSYQGVYWMDLFVGYRQFEYFKRGNNFFVILRWFKETSLLGVFFRTFGIHKMLPRKPLKDSSTNDKEIFLGSKKEMKKHQKEHLITEKVITIERPLTSF